MREQLRFRAARRAGPLCVNPAAEEARSFAFIFPFPGRVLRSVRFFCFVIDPRVNDIVSFMRQVPLEVRLPMRRERRTRWTIPNMRRS